MAFWKLFGKRTSRPAATGVRVRKSETSPMSIEPPASEPVVAPDVAPAPKRSVPKGGFDPYNSGAFDRRDNWDKMRLK